MRDVVCHHCNATVQVPDDLAQAHCVRCGQALTLPDTSVTELPGATSSAAIRSVNEVEWKPTHSQAPLAAFTEPYANWTDFRGTSPAIQRELIDLAGRPLPDIRQLNRVPLPDDIPSSADELGLPLAFVTMPGENRLVSHMGGLLVLALCISFSVLVVLDENIRRGPHGIAGGEITFFGAIIIFGLAFSMWNSFLRKPHLSVDCWILQNGIVCRKGRELKARRWEDIEGFRVLDAGAFLRVRLILDAGFWFNLSSKADPSVIPVLEFIETKLTATQLVPILRRIFDGERLAFGVVQLDRSGFTGKRFYSPWSEIAKVVSDNANLYVDIRGRSSWSMIPYEDISFPLLVMAISHVMIADDRRLNPSTA